MFLIAAAILKKHQKEDLILQQNIKRNPHFFLKTTYGTGSNAVELLTFHKKIYVPPALRAQVLKWYHNMLGHPGEQRTEQTIQKNLVWPGRQMAVAEHIAKCHECQIYKTHREKYGKLPLKQPDEKPWNTICVDLIGPYDVTTQDEEELTLNAMTIVTLFNVSYCLNAMAHTKWYVFMTMVQLNFAKALSFNVSIYVAFNLITPFNYTIVEANAIRPPVDEYEPS
jgi:hypothetical protein